MKGGEQEADSVTIGQITTWDGPAADGVYNKRKWKTLSQLDRSHQEMDQQQFDGVYSQGKSKAMSQLDKTRQETGQQQFDGVYSQGKRQGASEILCRQPSLWWRHLLDWQIKYVLKKQRNKRKDEQGDE